MPEEKSSREFEITDQPMADMLMDPLKRQIVMHCALTSRTIRELSDRLSLPLGKVHYQVRKLLARGLIIQVGELARAGRAMKQYQSVASRFRVPARLLPDPGRPLRAKLEQALERERIRSPRSLVIGIDPETRRGRMWPEDGSQDERFREFWLALELSPGQMQSLTQSMMAILKDAQAQPSEKNARKFLVHMALVPEA